MSHRIKGSPEEKLLLVQKSVNGETSAATASQLEGVKRSSFTNWICHYRPGKNEATAKT